MSNGEYNAQLSLERAQRIAAQEQEIAALKLALDACVDSAFEQDKTSAALLAGVNKVLALLDDEADVVDGEHGNQIPNTAMRIAQELREAIAKAAA